MFDVKFTFTYINEIYTIRGIVKEYEKTIYMNLGYAGDDFPCIMIEFDKVSRKCKISKLRAQKFGGWKNDDRIICMKPALKKTGALNILVHLSLAIVRKYIGKVITYINDGAMVDDRYPLSWKKFWIGKGTTYSKYGFRLREPVQKSEFFKSYMKNIRLKLQQKMSRFNTTIENYIKNLFNKRLVDLYDPTFKNSELKDIDIRGVWYMDWKYYDDITEKVSITNLKMKKIKI
jgi:hypothetical protein